MRENILLSCNGLSPTLLLYDLADPKICGLYHYLERTARCSNWNTELHIFELSKI